MRRKREDGKNRKKKRRLGSKKLKEKKEEKARKDEEAKIARQRTSRKRTSSGTPQTSNKRQKRSVTAEPSNLLTGDTIQDENVAAEGILGDTPAQEETIDGIGVNICCMCFGS